MLVALSQPHFSHYDWKAPDADANNGYARHTEFYARVAGSINPRTGMRSEENKANHNGGMNGPTYLGST